MRVFQIDTMRLNNFYNAMRNRDQLIYDFKEVSKRYVLPSYIEEIVGALCSDTLQADQITKVLESYNLNHSIAKVDFIHLLLVYINIALEDSILTTEEKENVVFLKRAFKISPGDFFMYNMFQSEEIIRFQLLQAYQDNFIDSQEAVLKTDLQEIFDLSFDQMNEYAKPEALKSIHHGADPKDLDIVLSNKEYFNLKSKSK